MSYIMSDLHTDETFPLAEYTIGKVLEMIDAEMDGILNESFHKWSAGTGEAITELLAIRDAFYELLDFGDPNHFISSQILNEGVMERFEATANVDEYLAGLGEQQLRAYLWSDLSDRCATCREFSDYCQGHGVMG